MTGTNSEPEIPDRWPTRHDLPERIGPVEISELAGLVAVRCPRDLDELMKRAGGAWEPGTRQWLIEPHRIRPVIRTAVGGGVRGLAGDRSCAQ